MRSAAGGLEAGFFGRALLAAIVLFVGFVFHLASPAFADALRASDYRMAGDAVKMRVVLDFDREPDVRWLLLRSPHRLVIDLPKTAFLLERKALEPAGLVSHVGYGALGEDAARIVLTGNGPFAVDSFEVLANEEGGYRLAIDISAASEAAFEAALAVQAETTGATVAAKTGRLAPPPKPFVVVIDPGHGGADGGAEGATGTPEKEITLSFAMQLRDKLAATGRYEVHMTRDKDEFLRLDDRVRIARQHAADLFISIHADTIRVKSLRGATVYTVSDKASDAEAQALAERENLSDQLVGFPPVEENPEVADILFDLIRRETHGFSIRFAKSLVEELSTSIGVINNPHRFAGFRVLRAPDVPSVLVELGYLSNTEDEERLKSAEWRGKAADSIAKAVEQFAGSRRAAGG
jgi:N-acetylmuramoyl-L-alanine amidase